jgi:ferredoxin-thioredoxin reductase catalytic chain
MKSIQIIKLILLVKSLVIAQAFAPSRASNTNLMQTTSTSTLHKPSPSTSTTMLHLRDENMTEEERAIALEKATKAMTAFSNTYIKNTDTKYCSDLSIPAVVIKGLAEHKVTLGAPLCPCRFYEDKEKEAKDGFWNCPCVPMRERHECHCMLFLTEDDAFVGDATAITFDEVVELSGGMP